METVKDFLVTFMFLQDKDEFWMSREEYLEKGIEVLNKLKD